MRGIYRKRENLWRTDQNREFKIKPESVKSYFDKTQSLVFGEDSARKEEEALLPFININSDSKVLDLGCGNGRWAEILVDKCKQYVGVDFSNKFVQNAREKYKEYKTVKFICLPAQDYLVDEQYDLILVIGLITYMNDEEIIKLSANCKKMLNNGGRLILRNVTLCDNHCNRKVYNYKPNIINKWMGKTAYQVIRRSREEELSVFKNFRLLHEQQIKGTGYTFYVFE